MSKLYSLPRVSLYVALMLSTASCSLVPHGQPGLPARQDQKARQQTSSLSGEWQLAFDVNGQPARASMRLTQMGNQLSGGVTEEASGQQFDLVDGLASGQNVSFKLTSSSTLAQALEFTGTVEMVKDKDYQGPWLHGKYIAPAQQLEGAWEAQMVQSSLLSMSESTNAPASVNMQGGTALLSRGKETTMPGLLPQLSMSSGSSMTDNAKAPQLSGRWNVAYEYNFKTVKSTMYLEQDGGKITGHGVDLGTKEKFVISKGWYAFPKLTLIRKYEKGKGAASSRTLTFKAEIKIVNDQDYQGPYLTGKTQGGGAWEGQLVR